MADIDAGADGSEEPDRNTDVHGAPAAILDDATEEDSGCDTENRSTHDGLEEPDEGIGEVLANCVLN